MLIYCTIEWKTKQKNKKIMNIYFEWVYLVNKLGGIFRCWCMTFCHFVLFIENKKTKTYKTNEFPRVDDHQTFRYLFLWFFNEKKEEEELTRKSSLNRHILNHMAVFQNCYCSVVDDYPWSLLSNVRTYEIFTMCDDGIEWLVWSIEH